MDATLLNELVSPWWKPIVFTAAMCLIIIAGIIAVRVTIRFDLNVWLKDRRGAKAEKNQMKVVNGCAHEWTLYSRSSYSRCNVCMGLIATTTLMAYRSPEVVILGENRGRMINPRAGEILVSDPLGARQ